MSFPKKILASYPMLSNATIHVNPNIYLPQLPSFRISRLHIVSKYYYELLKETGHAY